MNVILLGVFSYFNLTLTIHPDGSYRYGNRYR